MAVTPDGEQQLQWNQSCPLLRLRGATVREEHADPQQPCLRLQDRDSPGVWPAVHRYTRGSLPPCLAPRLPPASFRANSALAQPSPVALVMAAGWGSEYRRPDPRKDPGLVRQVPEPPAGWEKAVMMPLEGTSALALCQSHLQARMQGVSSLSPSSFCSEDASCPCGHCPLSGLPYTHLPRWSLPPVVISCYDYFSSHCHPP